METAPEKQLLNKHQFISSGLVVTKNVNAIIQQGDMSVPQMPNLPALQQDARQQCQGWLDRVWPACENTAEDIVHYAKTFQDIYVLLLDAVNKGGPDMKSQIIIQTKNLKDKLNDKKSSSDEIIELVKSFNSKFQVVFDQFKQDYAKAEAIIIGDNQQLRNLSARRESLYSEADKLLLESMIPFAGIYYAIKYGKTIDEINSISNQISAISDNLNAIQAVHDLIGGLMTHITSASTFSVSVSDGWQSLADNMESIISHITSISPDEAAIVVKIQLGAADKDWKNVLDQARGLGLIDKQRLFF